jgi:invasion protein IalB
LPFRPPNSPVKGPKSGGFKNEGIPEGFAMNYRIIRRLIAAISFVAPVLALSAGAEDASVLYRKSYGPWTVLCNKDPMNDTKRGCVFAAKGQGPSLIGQNSMLLETWSEDKTKKLTIRLVTPYVLMVSRGLMFRSDSDPPVTLACTRMENENNCDIQGTDRDALIASWLKATRVVVRSYTFNQDAKDYQFDMTEFAEGFRDFQNAVNQYL